MKTNRWNFVMVITVAFMILSACTSNDDVSADEENTESEATNDQEEATQEETNADPVSLLIALPFNEEIFQDRFGVVLENLPHIDLDWVYYDGTSEGLEELFAAGTVPDLINSWDIEMLQEYGAIEPLDDLIEKFDFDVSVIQPSLEAHLRSFDSENRVIGFPDGASYFGLYYNKEIFDLFGVPHPDPNEPMTWDKALDLTREMTGERDGINYIGLEFWDRSAPLYELAVNATDPSGDVLLTDKPEFAQFFELMHEYYNIPGIYDPNEESTNLFSEKRAAMSVSWHRHLGWGWGDVDYVVDMDIAPIPVWADAPTTGPLLTTWPIMVTQYSEHKDEAFQILMGYVSEENQLAMGRAMAAGPTTTYPEVLANFGANNEFYHDKNVSALFAVEPAVGEQIQSARWDSFVDFGSALDRLAESDIDVNTLLRELEEESEAKIKDAIGSQ